MENENEIVVPQTDTDTTENDELEINLDEDYSQEDVEALRKEVETLKAQKEHWRKKATQPIQKTEQPTTPVLSEEVVEVKILKSQGVSDELITQLKKIAKVNETGLIEAQADPYFVAYKDKLEEELKKAKASLGASRGSGSVKKGKDFSTSGLSDEEHKQLWKDRMGL
jgi:hypothetical protein